MEKPGAKAPGGKYSDGGRPPQGGLSPPPILGTLYQNYETGATKSRRQGSTRICEAWKPPGECPGGVWQSARRSFRAPGARKTSSHSVCRYRVDNLADSKPAPIGGRRQRVTAPAKPGRRWGGGGTERAEGEQRSRTNTVPTGGSPRPPTGAPQASRRATDTRAEGARGEPTAASEARRRPPKGGGGGSAEPPQGARERPTHPLRRRGGAPPSPQRGRSGAKRGARRSARPRRYREAKRATRSPAGARGALEATASEAS